MFTSIKNKLKSKVIKRSKGRGITFSDRSLFQVGSKFRYVIADNKVCIIESSQFEKVAKQLGIDDASHYEGTISKKGHAQVPLIDIRRKDALQALGSVDSLVVDIYEDYVLVQGYEIDTSTTEVFQEKAQQFKKATGLSKLTHLAPARLKKKFAVRMEKKAFLQASGEQQCLFDSVAFHSEISASFSNVLKDAGIPLQVASFFSGAGLLDEGFKQAGLDIVFALEKDAAAAQTYVHNHGAHMMCEDIRAFNGDMLRGIPIFIAGVPCQGFSNSNRHTHFLDNPNNLLLKEYIRVINESDCQIFVIENAPQILTAGEGRFLHEIKEHLSDFEISYGVLNAADYGSAQLRRRAIIIGSKIGPVSLPVANVSPDEYCTVGDALTGLHEALPNQQDYSRSSAETTDRMAHIPQGGNWEHLPDELRGNLRKGRTHSSILKRLCWDKPAITITNVRKSLILHPFINRVLSVRECARLFDLRDNYIFKGNLGEKQQQIANSVPVSLGQAIANAIKKTIGQFNNVAQGNHKPYLV